MTTKHKAHELEKQELLQEFRDGYITKTEYDNALKAIKAELKSNRIKENDDEDSYEV